MKIDVYDVTLRDGAQQEGINLSVADKLALMPLIESIGADYIEGGWPGAIPRDTDFYARVDEVPLESATLTAFGATRKAGVRAADDPQRCTGSPLARAPADTVRPDHRAQRLRLHHARRHAP